MTEMPPRAELDLSIQISDLDQTIADLDPEDLYLEDRTRQLLSTRTTLLAQLRALQAKRVNTQEATK